MIKLGVVILSTPILGGTYQYSLSTLEALRNARDYRITLYGDPSNEDLKNFAYPIREYYEPRVTQLKFLAAFRLGLEIAEPFPDEDLIFAPIYSAAGLHTKKPFAYTLHDLQEYHYPSHFSWGQRVWRPAISAPLTQRASRIFCEASHVKSDIQRFLNVPEEKVVVVAAPPLAQRGKFSSDELVDVRRRLSLPVKFLFYPAQFWPHKNHLRLLEAFKQVAARERNLHLVLTGKEKDDYRIVMQTIDRLELADRVLHLGYIAQNDLQATYRMAHALVMPSLYESVSIPIYEAFQAGIPVAASNILSIPEQTAGAALLFDPLSPQSMANAMLEIIDNPSLAKTLGERGWNRIASMTPEHYCEQLTQIFQELMGDPVSEERG